MDRALVAKDRLLEDLREEHLALLADQGSDGDSVDEDETAATEAAVDWDWAI